MVISPRRAAAATGDFASGIAASASARQTRRTRSTKNAATLALLLVWLLLAGCGTTPGRDKPLDYILEAVSSPDGTSIAASTAFEEVALFDRAPLRFNAMMTRATDRRSQNRLDRRERPDAPFAYTTPLLAFAPDGKTLVAVGVAGHLVAWDMPSRAEKYRVEVGDAVVTLAFSPDAQEFFTAGPDLAVWSAADGGRKGDLPLPAGTQAMSVAVSANGRIVLAGLSDGRIAIFDTASRQLLRTLSGHTMPVYGLAFSPDGSMFASTAGQYDPRIWKADPQGEFAQGERTAVGAAGAARASDRPAQALGGLLWLIGTVAGVRLVGAPTLGAPPMGSFAAARIAQAPELQPDPKACAPRIAFSPNGRYLASTGSFPGFGQGSLVEIPFRLFVTDLEKGGTRTINYGGCSFAFTPDSKFIITHGSLDHPAPAFRDVVTLDYVEDAPLN